MFSPRGRTRGSRSLVHTLFRVRSARLLLLILSAIVILAINFHRLGSSTWRDKDCAVPWRVANTETASSGIGGDSSITGNSIWSGHRERVSASSNSKNGDYGEPLRIALVSMSTGRGSDSAAARRQQAVINVRSAEFSGLLDVTGPNKRLFAEAHGYTYVDASDHLDNSRPASWSKIPAVLSIMDQYDWIFWLDADTLITNLTIPVEAVLPTRGSAPDLLLTEDSTGVNAGVWLIRGSGCRWCRSFLMRWWDMKSFIRRGAKDTKSGDNDALKHMLATMDSSERSSHIGVAPQCAFNSYLWRGSLRNLLRYAMHPRRMLTGLWRPGDFVMHAAGIQNKMAVLQRFSEAQNQQVQQLQKEGKLGGRRGATASAVKGPTDPRHHHLQHYNEGEDDGDAAVSGERATSALAGTEGVVTGAGDGLSERSRRGGAAGVSDAGLLGKELLWVIPSKQVPVAGSGGSGGSGGGSGGGGGDEVSSALKLQQQQQTRPSQHLRQQKQQNGRRAGGGGGGDARGVGGREDGKRGDMMAELGGLRQVLRGRLLRRLQGWYDTTQLGDGGTINSD
ncbi:hypothetical protein VaNZ11_016408 [Volvox africanus]|uniref:Glycosyltransferase family 34 protein n=1 Tax=Volvox africanus TaxID=51714 RepID=A0ABQ5SMR4_9CHLO|nr:hypothetical protein VaNZ11_016408 [Volvox africanus]